MRPSNSVFPSHRQPHHQHPQQRSTSSSNIRSHSTSAVTSNSTSSQNACSKKNVTQQQQQQSVSSHKNAGVTSMASPISSASEESLCSSSSSSSACSECSECDEGMHEHEHQHAHERERERVRVRAAEQATTAQQANNERTLAVLEGTQVQPRHHSHSHSQHPHPHTYRHTHPSSSSSTSTSRQPLLQQLQHASHSNLTASSTTSTSERAVQQQDQLFSPITSDGSVISMASSTALSIPASPDSRLQQREKHAEVRQKQREKEPEQTHETGTEGQDTTMRMDTREIAQEAEGDTRARETSGNEDAAAQAVYAANPPPANPRKSARRHSDNGMKTPDEAIYASRNYHIPSIVTSSAYPAVHSAHALPSTSTIHTDEDAAAAGSSRNEESSIANTQSKVLAERLRLDSSATAPLMTGRTASGPATFPSNVNGDNDSNPLNRDIATQNVPFASAPLEGVTSSSNKNIAGMIIPGERRIQNEEMRPARRKVHRVDTGDQQQQQRQTFSHSNNNNNNNNLMEGYVHTPMPDDAHIQPDENRRHLVQEKTDHHHQHVGGPTFQQPHQQQHRRPHPRSDSYFPRSNSNSNNISKDTSAPDGPTPSDVAAASASKALSRSASSKDRADNASKKSTSNKTIERGANAASMSSSTESLGRPSSSSTIASSSSSASSSAASSSSNAAHQQQPSSTTTTSSSTTSIKIEGGDNKEEEDEQRQVQLQKIPHMDIPSFPTNTLLQLLAALLVKITLKNDAIRDGVVSSSPASSLLDVEGSNDLKEKNCNQGRASTRQKIQREGPAGEDGDSEMQRDEEEDNDNNESEHVDEEEQATGIVTPPAQSSSSYNTNDEPVTPAVPFSSPQMTRDDRGGSQEEGQSSSSASQHREREKGLSDADDRLNEHNKKEKRAAASASASTTGAVAAAQDAMVSSSRNSSINRKKEKRSSETKEVEDAGLTQMRHNFSKPPVAAVPSSSASIVQSNGSNGQLTTTFNSKPTPLRSRSNTILTSAAQALSTPNATLCFHARNIPSISIEAYLIRISKYCPTTNEVFISLLVYFDRMSRLPNLSNLTSSLPTNPKGSNSDTATSTSNEPVPSSTASTGLSSRTRTRSSSNPSDSSNKHTSQQQSAQHSNFAVDSFNIHRLIIAGVTVASKFFSDVFYTNSRYAKVGGLPLAELNALELQFLLLNGFDLIVSPQELQRYADYLLIGALPPLAADLSDRFGPSHSTRSSTIPPAVSTTPAVTPPSSRSNTPSRTSRALSASMHPGSTHHGLFGLALRQHRAHQEPLQSSTPHQQGQAQALNTSFGAEPRRPLAGSTHSQTFRPAGVVDTSATASSGRPKTSSRSASESSTSASEASTIVPSESSVDTERGDVDHSTADESTGAEDDDEADGDSRMTDVSGAPSPAVQSSQPLPAQFQQATPKNPQLQLYPSNATLGADRDGFAIPARPRPVLSRTGSSGSGHRHPLLATGTGSKASSNSSSGHSARTTGKAILASIKSVPSKISTSKSSASLHRRDNSRTREWTIQQQQQMQQRGGASKSASSADDDAEMADAE